MGWASNQERLASSPQIRRREDCAYKWDWRLDTNPAHHHFCLSLSNKSWFDLAKACSICWLQFYYSCIEMWIKRWGKQCKEKCTEIKVPGAKKLCKNLIFRFKEQERVEMVIFIIVTMMILMIIMMVVMMMIKMTMVTCFHFGNKWKYRPSSSP